MRLRAEEARGVDGEEFVKGNNRPSAEATASPSRLSDEEEGDSDGEGDKNEDCCGADIAVGVVNGDGES